MRSKYLLSTVCFKTEVNFQTRSESVLEDHSGEKIGVIISTNNIESTVWGFCTFWLSMCVCVSVCVCELRRLPVPFFHSCADFSADELCT